MAAKESKEGGRDKFSTSLISKSNGSNRLQKGGRHKKSYKQWGRKRGGMRTVQCVCVLLSESIDGGSEKKCIDWISNLMGLDCSKSDGGGGGGAGLAQTPQIYFRINNCC